MISHDYQSAKATCHYLPSGLVEVCYYGVLSPSSFGYLREKMTNQTRGARGAIVRMDTGVTTFTSLLPVPVGLYGVDSPTAAVVVLPDHYEMWWTYAHALAEIGVMRAIFLTSQRDLAYRWAEAQARASLSGLPR
jgi:hypothetical protein